MKKKGNLNEPTKEDRFFFIKLYIRFLKNRKLFPNILKVYDEDFIYFRYHADFGGRGIIGVCMLNDREYYKVHKDFSLTLTDDFFESKLTSKDMKYIVEQTTKQLINEIKVVDAYTAYYKDIPEDIFQKIVTTIQGDNETLLPNTKWYLKMYKNDSETAMDILPELRQDDGRGLLDAWERCVQRGFITGQNSNLKNYKTLDKL